MATDYTEEIATAEELCAQGYLDDAKTHALIAIAKIMARWDKHYLPVAQCP